MWLCYMKVTIYQENTMPRTEDPRDQMKKNIKQSTVLAGKSLGLATAGAESNAVFLNMSGARSNMALKGFKKYLKKNKKNHEEKSLDLIRNLLVREQLDDKDKRVLLN